MLSLAITVRPLVGGERFVSFCFGEGNTMITPELDRVPFNIEVLHKDAKAYFRKLVSATATSEFRVGKFSRARFAPYEGFRDPMRQHYLVTETKATKARPWESAHQYGLAVDFAVRVYEENGTRQFWSWEPSAPWEMLKEMAAIFSLDVPIDWDRGHVVHPLWDKFQSAMQEFDHLGFN